MSVLHLDGRCIDLATGVVDGPGTSLQLSEVEVALLRRLALDPGQVVPRATLGGAGGSRAADMTISRLRQRLGSVGHRIVTVRGVGYRLDADLPPAEFDADLPPAGLDLGWGSLLLERRTVTVGERVVALSEQQTRLLALLAESPGQPVARARLASGLWGSGTDGARLDLVVHRLRHRLESDPACPRYLVSVRDRGLVLLDARPAPSRSAVGPASVHLLGRASELRETLALLEQEPRVVLLHGPPGIGKSALAIAAAGAWRCAAPARSHELVDLHGARDSMEVEGRVATALGMEDISLDPALTRSLAARGDLLLVLDGALPAALAARLASLLPRIPRLRLLVAARESLTDVPRVSLRGLPLRAAQELLERAAGRLLGPETAHIVRRVDANPLALELVGAGLRHASIADYERRLALPLTPLRRAWRAVLTSLSALDHHVALACSLFERPCDADDLAAVVGASIEEVQPALQRLVDASILAPAPSGLGGATPRVAQPLAARELLRVELQRDHHGRAIRQRYIARCQDLLRALVAALPQRGGPAFADLEWRWPDLRHGLGHLSVGASQDAAVLASLAREAGERVPRSRAQGWASELEEAGARVDLPEGVRALCLQSVHALRWSEQSTAERDHLLRRALDLAVQGAAPVAAASIAAELASVIAFSWGGTEAKQLLRTHPLPSDAPLDEQIRRHRHVGRLGVFAGRPSAGVARLREGVRLAEEGGLPLLEARCRMALGQALSAGRLEQEAEHHLRRAMALTAEHELPEQNVRATLRLAQHLLRQGLRGDARLLLDAALAATVRAGLARLEEQCASTLGYLLIGTGRLPDALVHLDRALELCREHGGKRALYVALANRGLALALCGRPDEARTDLHAALHSAGGGGGWYRALGLSYLSVANLLAGERERCAGSVAEALEVLAGLDHPDGAALEEALDRLGELAAGSLAADEAAAWVSQWSGGAEVEGVVRGIERASQEARREPGGGVVTK